MAETTPGFDIVKSLKRVVRDWWWNPEGNITGIPIPLVIGLPPTETGNLKAPMSSLNIYMKELDDMMGGVVGWLWANNFVVQSGKNDPMTTPGSSNWISKIFNGSSAALAKAARELALWSDLLSKEMFPILEIIPCIPKAVSGTNIFKLEESWELYHKILNFLGYRLIDDRSIRVAVQAESFPSETFTNDYGESFLERFTSIATSGASELGYMSGSRDFGSLIDQMQGILPDSIADQVKKVRGGINQGIKNAQSGGNSLTKNMADAAQLISKMSVGSRIDFPSVWKNSAFGPSWSFTVRLYNPHPLDKVSTYFYIIGPLATLMTLALPITEDGITYSWPFLLKCRIPGYLDGMATYIQSMTVIKGGDQQQIAQNQRLGVVDVRFELGCLYDTMLATTGKIDNSDRPTLKKYLDVMAEEKGNLFKRSKDYFSYLDRSAAQLGQTGRQLALLLKYGKNYASKWFNNASSNTTEKP